MATVLGSLLVSLGLDSAEFDRGLDKSRRNMRRAGQDFDRQADQMYRAGFKIGQGIKTLASTTVVAAGIGLVTNAVQEAVRGSLEYASSLGETAQQLGVTTDALQEYRYAATQVGLSQEEMDKALEQLTRRIGEAANGTKAQAEAFKVLGVSVKDANGNVINAGDAIPKLADALQKVHNPAQRAAILTDLFGKAGQKLEPLLSGGSAAVNELRDAAHKLGVVLSEEQIQKADDTADKLAALNTVLKARVAGVVADNADSILKLANAFGELVNWIGKAASALSSFQLGYRKYLAEQKVTRGLTPGVQAEGLRELQTIALDEREANWQDYVKRNGLGLGAAVKSNKPTPAIAMGGGGGGGHKARGGGRSGPSADEVAARFAGERASIMEQYNSVMASMAASAAEEAEYQLRNVELQRIRSIAGIKAEKDYSAAQKATLIAQQEDLATVQRQQVEREKQERLEKEVEDTKRQEYESRREVLQNAQAMATTDGERQRIALELLDLDEQFKRDALERIIASSTRKDAEKALAQAALDSLDAASAANRAAVKRQTETPAQAYMREINKTPAQINEAIDQIKIDGLNALNDGLVDALVNFRSLGDVAQSMLRQILGDLLRLQIQQSLIAPLAKMLGLGGSTEDAGAKLITAGATLSAASAPLMTAAATWSATAAQIQAAAAALAASGGGGGGGGLGGIGGILSGILGGGGGMDGLQAGGMGLDTILNTMPMFANGTNFAPGGLAIVGEKGPELVNLRRGAQVIPNHELGGMGGSTTHAPTFVFPGISDAKQAREAAGQAARRYRRELNPMRGM